ncbi:MAG: sulfite exporter TauE/SafE family protein [Acidobacteria bacterium]|nr:sulfite exporter TauE/SafE family protein [Acidobacteriota bacterium]
MLLEESLGAVPGVKHVRVRRTRSCATIVIGDQSVDEAALERAVEEAGYSVGHEHVPWLSRDLAVYFHVILGIAVIGIVALGLGLGGFSLPSFGTSSTSMTSSVALLVGLTAGFSTCMALIGGLVLAVSARFSKDNHHLTRWQKFQPHLAFNVGRIVGFGVLGGLLGSLGSVLQLSDRVIALLTLVVGLVMLLIGIKITEISPRIARFTPTLPRFLQWKRGDALRSSPPVVGAVASGALTFFLPCGFTLAMQLAAMNSGSFDAGALTMAAFALGTAPGLLGIGGLTSVVHGRFAKVFFATAGVLVIGLGIFNLRTGYATLFPPTATAGVVLTGSQTPSPQPGATQPGAGAAPVAAGTETITMTQSGSGYSPSTLTVHAGSHVRWEITSTDAYTCASGIRVPSLGIAKQLAAGQNVIEFIPQQEGDIPFSCSMGMYRGTIKVLPRST